MVAQSMAARSSSLDAYRLPILGRPDPLLRRCLQIAGAIGLAVLLAALLAPKKTAEITDLEEVPERFAKLILEEPKAPPAPPRIASPTAPKPEEIVKPKVIAQPLPKNVGERRQPKKVVPQDRGQAGRDLAQAQVSSQLTEVTQSLDTVLDDLSTSLASNDDGAAKPKRRSRRRSTRSGREASDLAGVSTAVPTVEGQASESSISGAQIAIESVGDLVSEQYSPDGSTPGGSATGSNEYRSDASLLAVVRKYAPGIQFCYDNELKKQPGLGGKLVVSITVAPSGRVTEAAIVRDTVGSAGLVSCALAQIEAWKFSTIPEGVVTFQAPFIFTPPE